MNPDTRTLGLAVLLVGVLLSTGAVAATVGVQFTTDNVDAEEEGNLTFGDQATASSTFTDGDPSDPGVVVDDVTAEQDSAVVVTYEEAGLEAGDEVVIDLDNVGSSAWEVTGVSGATDDVEDVVVEDVENPTLVFVEGVEYTFEDLPGDSFHPLEFFDDAGDALLSQDGEGSFEDDPDVGWEDTDDAVTFTATEALAAELDGYICTFHGSMEGGVQTTAEDDGDLVIAGLELFDADELNGDTVAIAVDDVGGFPGEHVAHVIAQDDLSGDYEPGDVVSAETAEAVLDNDGASVFQGTVEFEDQSFDEPIEEGDELTVATADLLDGAGGQTEFVVDIHPTNDEGELVAAEFVGASDVVVGENDDIAVTTERVPEDGEFNEFPLTGTDDFVAMFHLVDDDAEPGDPASPGEYPLLTHASANGVVPGGVTDDGTITAGDVDAGITFDDQATASSTFTDENVTIPGVVAEGVTAEQDSAVVVTYEEAGLEAGDEVTIDLDNVGASAWAVAGVSGATDDIDDVVVEDVENPTLTLVEGVEYTFEDLPGGAHPLEFFDDTGDALLSQDGDGSFEDDPDVGWEDTGDTVTFTATEELAAALDGYVCTIHGAMEGGVQTTAEDDGDLVIAGLGVFDADELNGDDVTIPVEEFGGFPGDHVAHVIPVEDLSEEYAPGDVVSAETADAVLVNDGATVFQGVVEFDDQNYEDATTEVEAGVAALVGDKDTLFAVDLHETTEEGAPGAFVGSSPVLSGQETLEEEPPTDVPIVLQDTGGEPIEFTTSDDYIAMFHVVDDEDVEEGDLLPPGTFPVLPHADAVQGFVPGGVTDGGEVGIFSAEGAELSFEDQAVGIDENGDVVVFVDELTEAEQIEQTDVSDPSEDFLVVYEGAELTQDSLVDFRNVGDAEDGELLLRVGDAEPGTHTVELFADLRSDFDPDASDVDIDVDHPFVTNERADGETASDETSYILLLEEDLTAPRFADTSTVVESYKSQASQSQEPVVEQLDRMGLSVDRQFWLINAVTTTVDDSVSAADLESIAGVEHAVENVEYQLPRPVGEQGGVDAADVGAMEEFTFGLEQIDVPGFEETFDDQGGDATVAIIDDGISTPDDPHPDLDISIRANVIEGEVIEGELEPGSHGEHVAGTATGAAEPEGPVPRYGVAPEAELIKINSFAGGGSFLGDSVAGVEFAVENDADVASMSLGVPPVDGLSTVQLAMEETMQNANDAGTVVIGSAGNEGAGAAGGPVTSPGAEFTGLSVGASNEAGDIAAFSSGAVVTPNTAFPFTDEGLPGPYPEHYPRSFVKPDVSAPGVDVLSAGPLGTPVAEDPIYSLSSGTSMAAPHAAGAVALIQSATDVEHSPQAIENALAETAEKPADAPGGVGERDIRFGTGIINVTAATLTLEETTTVSGTVTDADTGDTLTGAHITTDTGATTSTQDGEYSIEVTADVEEVAVSVDEFGFTAETETVPVGEGDQTVDFALDPEVDLVPVAGQPPFAEFQDEFDIVVDVRNLEEYTVDLADAEGVTAEDIDVFVAGQPVEIGEPVEFEERVSGDGVPVTVETDGAFEEGDQFALEHTFAGPGEPISVTTGPTTLTEDQAPAQFRLTDFEAPDSQPDPEEPVDYVPSVTVTNTGQTAGAAEVRWFAGPLGLAGDDPVVDLEPGESETVALNFGELNFAAVLGAEVELLHGFDVDPAGAATGDLTFDRFPVGDAVVPLLDPINPVQTRDAAETAGVFAADVTIEDQQFIGSTGELTVATSNLVPDDQDHVVVIHEDTEGLPVLGSSGDLTGPQEDLTIELDEPLAETTDVVAMVHFAEDGEPFGPPVTAFSADAGQPVPVTDTATAEIAAATVSFDDQVVDATAAEQTVQATNVDSDGTESAVIVTYAEGEELIIAGLETGTFDDESVTVTVGDAGGVPGEHTAHVVPVEDLSQEYAPGDAVSAETAEAILNDDDGNVEVDLTGDGNAATDTTGDGNLNSVAGGAFDILDVQALFESLDNELVQANADLFDFAGLDDDRVSIFDVQGLFTELQAETGR